MKKYAFLLLTAVSQCLNAASHPSFTGPYVTGGVGATNAQFHVQPDFVTSLIFEITFPGSIEAYGTSPYGLIGVGYTHQLPRHFVLGGQVTAGYGKIKTVYGDLLHETVSTVAEFDVSNQLEMKLTNDFALQLKAGYIANEKTLFYALIGPRWGHFATSLVHDVYILVGGDPFTSTGSDSTSGYETGFTAGLGMQQIFTNHFSVSLEYDYTNYGEIDASSVVTDLYQSGAVAGTVRDIPIVDTSSHTLMLLLSYQW